MTQATDTRRVALVTGGGSGIGLATVEMLAKSGIAVALNHLPGDPRGSEEVARLTDAGLAVLSVPADVSDAGAAEGLVGRVLDAFGRLDFLVNNAGTADTRDPIPFEHLDAMTDAFWGTILATNLLGPFRCSRAASEALRTSRGAIVNVASVAGLGRRGSSLAYAASKAGLINVTKGLARALAPDVRINAVAPGLIETGWTEPWPAQRKAATVQRTLLNRLGQSAEVAAAILFLLRDATYMTGETIVVDGGSD